MFIVSLVSFGVTIYLILESIIRKSDLFSPARVYLLFHSLTLGVAFLALHPAMTPFQPLTSIIYFGSSACFLLGVAVPNLLGRSSTQPLVGSEHVTPQYNWNLHFILATALFGVFLVGILLSYKGGGGFPLLAENKSKTLFLFNNYKYIAGIAYNLGATAMALFYIYTLKPSGIPKYRNPGFWMLLLTIAIFSLTLNRVGPIFFAFFAIVYFHETIRRVSVLKLSLFFVFFLGLFMTIAYLKLNDIEKKYSLDLNRTELAGKLLKVPYVYVANNYWNLDYALNPENSVERHPTTYGYTMMTGVLDMMSFPGGNLGISLRESYGFEDMFHKNTIKVKGLNTFTYQWGLYKDFGVAGTMILPFLFGAFIKVLYLNVRRHPSIFRNATYGYLAFFVAFSWFTAMWEMVTFVYGFFYLAACCYLCQAIASREARTSAR